MVDDRPAPEELEELIPDPQEREAWLSLSERYKLYKITGKVNHHTTGETAMFDIGRIKKAETQTEVEDRLREFFEECGHNLNVNPEELD